MSTEITPRKPYLTDVSDEEWAFLAPYLTLISPAAPQRTHDLREVFNALRWLVSTGGQWRMLPHDLPPWEAVHQQTRRWMAAGCFEAIIHDFRAVLRTTAGKKPLPTAAILDSRTLRSTPESGARARAHSKVERRRSGDLLDPLLVFFGRHREPPGRATWGRPQAVTRSESQLTPLRHRTR